MSSDRPIVFLFVDHSPASAEAVRAFRETDVELAIVHATGPSIPSAKLGNTVYAGKWGIDFLLGGLAKGVSGEALP